MKNPITPLIACLLVVAVAPLAPAGTILSDSFSTNTISSSNRLRVNNSANAWIKDTASLWTVASGVASNAGTTAGAVSEGGLLRVFDVGAASLADYTKLTFSFDYTVGAGSTLYFYAIGLYNGTLTGNTQLHNTGAAGGSIQSQYDGYALPNNNQGDYTGMNLKNGAASPNGVVGDAYSFASGTSGTFTQEIDISSYTGINDINDFQYLTMGWSSKVTNYTGAGAITLDNFKLEGIPEPSSFALLIGSFGMLTLLRRRGCCLFRGR